MEIFLGCRTFIPPLPGAALLLRRLHHFNKSINFGFIDGSARNHTLFEWIDNKNGMWGKDVAR